MSVAYLDSSALVKLAVLEDGSDALLRLVATHTGIVTSAVALVEVPRALRRVDPDIDAGDVLDRCAVIHLDPAIVELAGRLDPPSLRSLDAIHVASALAVLSDLDAFVTFDDRQADAASAAGLPVQRRP